MNSEASESESCDKRTWGSDLLWIAVVVAVLAGRILAIQPSIENRGTPFMSANDRSRWATVRALGDDGTYAIDELVTQPRSVWDSIDKVAHLGSDGQMHVYSSKPTLFPTLLALQYRCVRALTGWSLDERPFATARVMLLLTNLVPLALLLLVVVKIARDRGTSAWTRGVLVAGLGVGTFLGTFVVTLNNHLPAAVSVGLAIWAWWELKQLKLASSHETTVPSISGKATCYAALGGAAAAFAASSELPALSFFAMAVVGFFLMDWKRTLFAFLPAAGLVACAHFGTNWQAHQSFRPAYAHRSDGAVIAELGPDSAEAIAKGELTSGVRQQLNDAGCALSNLWAITPGESVVPQGTRRWVLTDLSDQRRWALVQTSAEAGVQVREWDNWYEYPGSYWTRPIENRSPVDRGEPSRWRYGWHMLAGHHGILSLTPLFLMAIYGLGLALRPAEERTWKLLALGVVGLTLVCFTFYLTRPLIDRNYGGQTSVLRWMMWFAPLWMLLAVDAIERAGRSLSGRSIVLVLLGVSIASAGYSALNPWVHPWLYVWLGGE